MISKIFYKRCIEVEIYRPFKDVVNRKLSIFDKIRCKYFSPELNAVYLIRKMQYYRGLPFFGGGISKLIHNKLIRRYGIFVNIDCTIDLGLRIYHPTSIVITNAMIGKNFTIFQNCTIGQKYPGKRGYGLVPKIGDNCVMCAGSSIIGEVKVADGVVVGAHSCLLGDAVEPGIYIGQPARFKKTQI